MNDNFSVNEIKLFNYELYRCDRNALISNKLRGGGVIIAVSNRFNSRLVTIPAPSLSFDHVFVSVDLPGDKLLLGCTYIPPDSSLDVYLEHCNVVEQLRNNLPDSRFFLAGDYNLKTARWRDEEEAGMLVECSCASAISLAAVRVCESFNGLSLRQVNSLPNNHGVFLDLLFSDCSETSTHIAHDLLLENNFHHLAFCFDIPLKERVEFITEVVQIYDYAKCDLIELKSYLSKVDWSFILSQDDINSTVESFNNILLTGIELSTPHRIIHPSSFPRWFSGDLRRLIFVKKIAHLTFKRTNLRSDYDRFSSLRAHCCFLRDNCHKSHLKKVNKYVKSNPRYFWRYCDETRKVSGYPKDMFLQGVTSSTPQETANLFADSFSSVYMASDLPIPEYALHDLVDFNTCSVSESEVFKALSSLPPKFSSGPDCIPFFILKKCASDLARPLTLIFNKSLSTGVFPVTWKKSFVIPIFKSGNRSDVANYRGVCIQSAIPKILDRLVCTELASACKQLISNHQHGFVPRRSTVTNLLSYQHDILQAIQSGQAVHSVYTDVAKAFDRVDTRFLIAKMRSYGLGDSILHWFSDYLAGRTQQVRIGNSLSSPIDVLSGVGQGSHTGPLLFSLFFNDLPEVIRHSSILMFADDVKLYKSISDNSDCILLQSDLDRFTSWLTQNGMQLSLHKCAVIEFSRSHSSYNHTYNINAESLPYVQQIKDLGILFDRNLSFIPQISNLSLRCHKVMGYVFRNSKGLSSEAFSLLYKSLVRSLLEYASIVWSPYYEVHSYTLERVQRRFLSYFRYRFPQETSSLDTLAERRKMVDLRFLDKLVEGQIDCSKLLELINFDCSRRIRHCKTFYVDKCDRNYLYFAPINRMMRVANST